MVTLVARISKGSGYKLEVEACAVDGPDGPERG